MATGIVLTVVEKLYAALHSAELKEVCSMFGYESQVDELALTVSTIKSVLLDAESKHQELSHEGRGYIERLKEAVYDVDDLLDEFNTMVQRGKMKKGGKISQKVRRFFSHSNQLFVAYTMSHDLKYLRNKLDKIAKDRLQFGLSNVYVPLKRKDGTFSYASDDNFIGREDDKESIVNMLIGDSKSTNNIVDKVSFVSIIGMGWLGKTALAQLVYNDHRIENAFELRLWVCVFNDFVLEQIFHQMLEKNVSNKQVLQREIRKLLEGKRYLLVLDDAWSESRDEWDKLKLFLDLGRKGSRVIVTSRSKKVARILDDDRMYELKGLSEENSWDLFKKFAFKRGEEPINNDDHLFDISKEISRKCSNVPLAIRVIGSMLYDQDESKWLSLKSANNYMKMEQGEEGILPILRFSYYDLSPAVKSCFSYCVLFPKDFVIRKELLIQLWLVQGCLDQPHDCRIKEDVGEEYFSILLNRCFLQDATKDEDDEIISCKMHDLIHDLAQDIAGKETIMLDSCAAQLDRKHFHLSIPNDGYILLDSINSQLSEMKRLRTLLQVSEKSYSYKNYVELNVTAVCSHLRRLRVLDLHNFQLNTLPDTVGNLSHLRYLDLSENDRLEALPNLITKLYNLQVLNLDDTGVKELPQDMGRLVNLRHLSLQCCFELNHMPASLDKLTCLHTLTTFVVGREASKQANVCKLRDLKALVNLRGDLTIDFKSLQPHNKLKEIAIGRYQGFMLPSWAQSLATLLPHLVKINLQDFDNLEVEALPSLCQLRHLKCLKLNRMGNVEFMESDVVVGSSDDELLFFPSLQELELSEFPKLKGWWREGKSRVTKKAGASSGVVPLFPCLHRLILEHCPMLTSILPCPNLSNLILYKCHEALALLRSATGVSSHPTTVPSSNVLYLKEVAIDNIRALDCFFTESLRGIDLLKIVDFEGESLSIVEKKYVRHDFCIKKLEIWHCPNLMSLLGVVKNLTSLQSLDIRNCINFDLEVDEEVATPWNSGHLLSTLRLSKLPKLVNMPKEFQYLTSLQVVMIENCENLEALPEWLNCLTSLQKLSIFGCDNLKLLPEAISHMPSLKSLDLRWCGESIRKRCRQLDGEDWPKIRHIPHLLIEE